VKGDGLEQKKGGGHFDEPKTSRFVKAELLEFRRLRLMGTPQGCSRIRRLICAVLLGD
jgi:hypothetical protein